MRGAIKLSNDIRKKEAEKQILKKVFGENVLAEESEQPDFILKYGENIKHGVEITELYYDCTSARIKNKRYILELLKGKKHWHKDDKKKLKVHSITYFPQSNGNLPIVTQALFLPKNNMQNYVKSLKQTIELKNIKLRKYCSDISTNCMLVIYDKENPFKNINEKDIAKQLFFADLSKVIRESKYQEIYLVTEINKRKRYIQLKAYLLQSDFLLLREFIKENNLMDKFKKTYIHPLSAFAEILIRRGETVTFNQVDNDEVIGKLIAYCGRYGIGMINHDNDNWGVGLFDTYPLQDVHGNIGFELDPNTDFFDDDLYVAYERMVQNNIASVGLFFPTKDVIISESPNDKNDL